MNLAQIARNKDIFFMKRLLVLSFVVIVFLLAIQTAANADETNIIQNAWALGIDNASGCPGDINDGWTHSATVSLSRCPKNPSPYGLGEPGAAFKNGPVSGLGQPGVETTSSQLFTLPYAESHELSFSALIICVRCDYLIAELYGDGAYLGELLHFTDGTASCGVWDWERYCGDPLVVPHATEYEIVIRSLWTKSNSLGVKWTGLELLDVPIGPTPTPTATPEPTATAVYLPLILEPGAYELQCPGALTIVDNFAICEAGQ